MRMSPIEVCSVAPVGRGSASLVSSVPDAAAKSSAVGFSLNASLSDLVDDDDGSAAVEKR